MGYEVDFLPVGNGERSGDSIALRFGDLFGHRQKQRVVVIDGGFKESGEEIVKHIRTYYHTDHVDLVVSTHPDEDHTSGLEVVLNNLHVEMLWMHQPWKHTEDISKLFADGRVTDKSVREALRKSLEAARNLEQLAMRKGIPIVEPFARVSDQTGYLRVLGPTEAFYESLLPDFRGTPGAKESISPLLKTLGSVREYVQKVLESWGLETLDDSGETTPENNSSTILLLTIEGQNLMFNADAGIPALTEVVNRLDMVGFDFSTLSFIQVPHHGSRRNVGPSILNHLVGPKLKEQKILKTAFVSASKDGEPKHPSKKVTNAFMRRGAPVHATQGSKKYHYKDAPDRGWSKSVPLPFYNEVEE